MEPKMLYCIRHGESTYNEWRRQSFLNFSWLWVRDPMLVDAPLSIKGRQQTELLHDEINARCLQERIELIITSPLTRAVQTMTGGFRDADIPILLEPLCREMLDTACDIGRQPEELAASFVTVNADFHALESFWWLPPGKRPSGAAAQHAYEAPRTRAEVAPLRESSADVDGRIRALVAKLDALPQTRIALVGHSAFFKRLLGMGRKLNNCELVEVPFAEVAQRFGIAPRDA
ncbi:hypothetical protein PybrP1_000498 [[Pythium] brassicae (nom. inval.)]|nr:hypothetical protein PybrP1_000498 [[Pythium] brassicae (nom. inval.)]